MRKTLQTLQSLMLAVFVMMTTAYSCHAQNGPSQPAVTLTWTQSTAAGVTANCIYRCIGASCTPAPTALFCSTAPITTYTDSTVAANSTDGYAVTAKVGTTESGYSNIVVAVVPANPPAPSSLQAPTVTRNETPAGLDLWAQVEWKRGR